MSFTANKTTELRKGFMSRVKQLNIPETPLLYSVEVYNDVDFFNSFDSTERLKNGLLLKHTI
jgi:hypothetical protein